MAFEIEPEEKALTGYARRLEPAVWWCPACSRVVWASQPSAFTPNRICSCGYRLGFTTRMEPINEPAREIEAYEQREREERQEARSGAGSGGLLSDPAP